MVHKFDVKNKHKLDNEERRRILPAEKTLLSLGLKNGDTVVDIGCGIGYFSIPAAKIAGASGRVYALDISEEMLEETAKRAAEGNISNITAMLVSENELKFNEKASFAFLSNVLHELEHTEKMLENVKDILQSKGRIAIVEWKKAETEFGPPVDHRVDKDEMAEMLSKTGFSNISIIDIGENFYGITAEKE